MDLIDVIAFLVLWGVASLIWAIWLDGIAVPAAGAVTAGIASGGFKFVFQGGK